MFIKQSYNRFYNKITKILGLSNKSKIQLNFSNC